MRGIKKKVKDFVAKTSSLVTTHTIFSTGRSNRPQLALEIRHHRNKGSKVTTLLHVQTCNKANHFPEQRTHWRGNLKNWQNKGSKVTTLFQIAGLREYHMHKPHSEQRTHLGVS